MGKTFAEKVLARAAGASDAVPGQVLDVYPHLYMSPNASWRCIRTMEKLGTDQIYDLDHIMFLRNYLAQLQRATADGVPIHGYFLWSLMDNFEWAWGYRPRFGLMRVEFDSGKRIPKESARCYS